MTRSSDAAFWRTPPPARPFSISPPHGKKSHADWVASLDPKRRSRLLRALSPNAIAALPWLFEFWGRVDHQLPPETPKDWTSWVVLGGRGAGKTRTGAEWVRAQVEGPRPQDAGRCRRVALLAATLDQARDVMVLGESGLLAVTPPDRRPVYQPSRRRVVWPNGAEAQIFSAMEPETLRGPQFDAAWSDELAKWRNARAAWDMLQFGLRLGDAPRQVVTTTPRRSELLLELLTDENTVVTRAATQDNAAHLAPAFLTKITRRYQGTALGRQELAGELLLDPPGALWTSEMLEGLRLERAPPCTRIVVAVDPPAASHAEADACGIIVAGLLERERIESLRDRDGLARPIAVVLADASVRGVRPQEWAARVVGAHEAWRSDRVVAEVNQGGDMVEAVLRQIAPELPYRAVRATRGKSVRAEPVAALYEQGRVRHLAGLEALEREMCGMTRGEITGPRTPSRAKAAGGRSPDRVDALVWAITELLLTEPPDPKVRTL